MVPNATASLAPDSAAVLVAGTVVVASDASIIAAYAAHGDFALIVMTMMIILWFILLLPLQLLSLL